MVKRQTVWLSTMMVLSLMLIGYYTMNNQASPASTTPSSPTSTTQPTTPTTSSSTGGSLNSTSHASSGTSSTSAGDWFTQQQTLVNNTISQKISGYESIIANNNASQEQVAQASKAVGEEQALWNNLQQATQAILAEGYKSAVITPDKNQQNFEVYVQSSHLQNADAVKIMNIVSQQLDISMLNISVKAHS